MSLVTVEPKKASVEESVGKFYSDDVVPAGLSRAQAQYFRLYALLLPELRQPSQSKENLRQP